MSTESISDRREHIRSVSVTALAALLGVLAGFASMAMVGDVSSVEAASEAAADRRPLMLVLGAIFAQFVLYDFTSIYDDDETGPKHYLFIVFMTFSLWFVTWGILLTTEAAA